jgi:hypothetical protein
MRNPVTCDPIQESFIRDIHDDDVFPNENFFPDIDNLFSDMSLTGDNTNNGPRLRIDTGSSTVCDPLSSVSDYASVLAALNWSRLAVVQANVYSKLFRPTTCLLSATLHD